MAIDADLLGTANALLIPWLGGETLSKIYILFSKRVLQKWEERVYYCHRYPTPVLYMERRKCNARTAGKI